MTLRLVQQNVNKSTDSALLSWVHSPGDGRHSLHVAKDAGRKKRGAAPQSERTHYLLSGGMWNIPAPLNDSFLWHYAVSIFQGHESSIVERRTDYFRFHVDMDFAEANEVPLTMLVQCVVVIQQVLRKFFPLSSNDCFECTVSAAPTKMIENADASLPVLVKTGFHVIWAHFWVTQQQALCIRASIIVFLKKKFGLRTPPHQNLWENVVDESIYVANGLRMIGSTKFSPCKCRRTRSKEATADAPPPAHCTVCDGKGTYCEGRVYWVVALLDVHCNQVTRKVKRPEAIAGPALKCDPNLYVPCVYQKANGVPEWDPPKDDDVVVGDDQVPIVDLLYMGDPTLLCVDDYRDQPPAVLWSLVHKLHNTLRFTSIRMSPELSARVAAAEPDAIPTWKKYQLAPPAASADDIEKRKASEEKNGVRRPRNARKKVELLNEFKQTQKDNILYVTDEPLIADLQEFIRRHVGLRLEGQPELPYADVTITNVVHFDTGKAPDRFFVHVEGVGSAFCRNREGDHNSNSIYFEIGPDKKRRNVKYVWQKCFCRCPTTEKRNSGLCKSYRNKEAELPVVLRNRLFDPNVKYGVDEPRDLKAELATKSQPFDARKVLSIFDDTADFAAYERYRARKREAEARLGMEDPEKRRRSLADAEQVE